MASPTCSTPAKDRDKVSASIKVSTFL